MRVALCLFGLVGGSKGKNGKGGNIDYRIAYDHYKRHILDKNDVDIFIHSWSIELERELIDMYKPKKCIFEKPIIFDVGRRRDFCYYKTIKSVVDKSLRSDNLRTKANVIRELIGAFKKVETERDSAQRAHSRWYSTKRCMELKREYELENNFIYDCVMFSRLDLAFFTDVVFDKYDMEYFYASHWNDAPNIDNDWKGNRENHFVGKGFLDLWFFSNSRLIDKFSDLYSNIDKYDINPHLSSRQHIDTITDKIKYVFYRWEDYELVRRKILETTE